MHDIGIIGAGPAGYTAAIRAKQCGLNVILFEKQYIGGTCLNKGCIPTKSILRSCNIYSELKNSEKYGINAENIAVDFAKIQERQKNVSEKIRKSLAALIKSYGINLVNEEAKIDSNRIIRTKNNSYEVKNIIIASGSKPGKIKFRGNYTKDFILTSDDVLNLVKLPQSVLIAGSGAVGIEWARIFSALGVKVVIAEIMENIIPSADFEVSERAARILKRNRIEIYTSCTVSEIQDKTVTLSNGKSFEFDFILLAAGRQIDTDFGEISNELKTNKFINTDCNFKTNIDNIYAIGDINGKSLLAHSAMKQARDVIEYIISGKNSCFDNNLVPSVIYGSPEIASIGKTEQSLKKEGVLYKKSLFPVSALGKARTDDKIEGFIKILANDDEILGAHIISEEADAMIEQIAITITNKLAPCKLHDVIFAHPTYSEGVSESIFGLDNIAVHIPPNQIQ